MRRVRYNTTTNQIRRGRAHVVKCTSKFLKMPTCPVCGSEDFELQDGHYFCNECSTQSQEIREEKNDEESMCMKNLNRRRVNSSQKQSTKEETLPKLYKCEILNLILYHQVGALIELGVSPHLKRVVMDLWFSNLKRCEQAFCSNEEDFVPRLSSIPSFRDVLMVKADKPIDPKSLHLVRQGRRSTKFYRARRELEKQKKERKSPCFSKSIERKVHSSHILKSEGSASDSEAKRSTFQLSDKKHYSKIACKKIRSHGIRGLWCRAPSVFYNAADNLNTRTTVAFCYAGILLLQEQIIPADIARWIREGRIPYLNAYRLIPESTKLTFIDQQLLKTVHVPNVGSVIKETMKLMYDLKIRVLPPQPVYHLAIRFIMDLNLPSEIAAVLHTLVTVVCPALATYLSSPYKINRTQIRNFPFYDMQAASLVIMALKMIFGLDGTTERDLSKSAKEENKSQKGGEVFVWDDWEEQAYLIYNLQKRRNFSSSLYSASEALDVGALHAFMKETTIRTGSQKFVETKTTAKKRTIHKAFAPLIPKKDLVLPQASSFPISAATSQSISEQQEVTFVPRDFSSCSLPRKGLAAEDDFAYMLTPSFYSDNFLKEEFFKCFPPSQRILINCLLCITNEGLPVLARKLRQMEYLLLVSLRKKRSTKMSSSDQQKSNCISL